MNGPVVSVAAGASQLPLIRQAKAMGHRVLGLDADPAAPGLALCDLAVIHSTHDADGALQAVVAALGSERPAAVVARTTGAPLLTAAAIAERFGLPGLTPGLVDIATSKSALRAFCVVHGLPAPAGTVWDPARPEAARNLLPAIVKPDATIIGKAAITLCADADGLDAAAAEAGRLAANGRVEVSAWLDGVDIGCFCRAVRGRAEPLVWWDELVGLDGDDRITGLGLSMPSVIAGRPELSAAADCVAALVARFPEVETMLAVSLRIDFAGRPHIIEVHADLGGDGIAEWLFPAAGVDFDFFAAVVGIALGRPVTPVGPVRKPVLLAYTGSGAGQGGHILVHEGSVARNLQFLADTIARRAGGPYRLPAHARWLAERGP